MLLAIQPNLVERTVFEAVRADTMLREHYERQFAACHEHRDPARRDQAFAEMHERWFNELGLRGLIHGLVGEFSRFRDHVSRLMVTQAHRPRAQSAELFGSPGQYTVVIAVAPSTLLDRPAFEYWARHEFMHIDDMLDPGFGYHITERPRGATSAARNLAQDRYAVLWGLYVDARLTHRGLAPAAAKEMRQSELVRVFALRDDELARRAFDELWLEAETSTLSHDLLLKWAEHGPPQIRDVGASSDAMRVAPPGSPCALCGFPTFDWAPHQQQGDALEAAILADFPAWRPEQPICTRCAEIYQAAAYATGAVA